MADQLGLFSAPPAFAKATAGRPSLPTAADVVAAGLTPMQWFERRYPRARNLRGQVDRDVVREGIAAPGVRISWDAWYREHWGAPVEVARG